MISDLLEEKRFFSATIAKVASGGTVLSAIPFAGRAFSGLLPVCISGIVLVSFGPDIKTHHPKEDDETRQ